MMIKTVILKPLLSKYIDEAYLRWINDPETTRYLTTKSATIKELKEYCDFMDASPKHILFGIYTVDNIHIGNIALNNIETDSADTGVIIGAEYRRKGYATLALKEILKYARERGIQKVWVAVHPENYQSVEMCRKVGFIPYSLQMQISFTG